MRTRTCNHCGHTGPAEQDFPPQKGGVFGRRPVCRSCWNKTRRTRRVYKTQDRPTYLKYKYGLSLGQYEGLLKAQSGKCKICGCPPDQSIKGVLAVDHDHITGQVRGLLCGLCNSGIGKLKDNPELLRAAAAYLEGY